MSILMDARFALIALPPSDVVSRIDPAAGKLVGAFESLDASLPVRRTPEDLNALDEAMSRAQAALGEKFFQKVAEQRAERRERMRVMLADLRALWGEEEADAGLERWKGSRNTYAAQPTGGLSYSTGPAGYKATITGKQMILKLIELLGG